MWLELRYAPSRGPAQSRRIWLEFRYAPYRGPGPQQGGYGLSFDTPPYRRPGPKQGGYVLSFDTPPNRGPGPAFALDRRSRTSPDVRTIPDPLRNPLPGPGIDPKGPGNRRFPDRFCPGPDVPDQPRRMIKRSAARPRGGRLGGYKNVCFYKVWGAPMAPNPMNL